jgi:hypothetical protein
MEIDEQKETEKEAVSDIDCDMGIARGNLFM